MIWNHPGLPIQSLCSWCNRCWPSCPTPRPGSRGGHRWTKPGEEKLIPLSCSLTQERFDMDEPTRGIKPWTPERWRTLGHVSVTKEAELQRKVWHRVENYSYNGITLGWEVLCFSVIFLLVFLAFVHSEVSGCIFVWHWSFLIQTIKAFSQLSVHLEDSLDEVRADGDPHQLFWE